MTSQSKCKSFGLSFVCLNHGICDEIEGKCICDVGWTSMGDFSTQSGVHCGINEMAIQALWIVSLITCLPTLYFSITLLFNKIKNRKKQGWQFISDPQIIAIVCFVINPMSVVVASILKIVDQETFAIALHPASTLAFYLFFISVFLGGCAYLLIMIKFILGYVKVMSSESNEFIRVQNEYIRKFVWFISIIIPFTNCPPLVNLTYPFADQICLKLFLIGIILATFCIPCAIIRYLGVISNEIGKYLLERKNDADQRNKRDDEAFATLKIKFERTRIAAFIAMSQAVALYILFLGLDILKYNTSYLWPTIMSIVSVTLVFLLKSLTSEAIGSTSSDSQNGKDMRSGEGNYAIQPQHLHTNR